MKQAFLGIDVSKGYADFLLLDHQKQVLEPPFQLQDNLQGRKQLKALLQKWLGQGIQQLCCGVESTGGYENNWYKLLKAMPQDGRVLTARLNARAVKSISDAVQRRTITDAVSAENIALYLISFSHKVDYGQGSARQQSGFEQGRQHQSFIQMLQKQKVQLTNHLEKLLYQYFSELLVYCRNGLPLWLLHLLALYGCAEALKKAGVEKLIRIKGISQAKAEALLHKASLSEQSVSKEIQRLIRITAEEVLHKEELIAKEKEQLRHLYGENEQVKLLDSVVGIGVDSAIVLAMEIEDIQRFEAASKLCAYFGLHPCFKQSGDGLWGNHLSKKGRSEVRRVLYMSALTAVRSQAQLKALYHRLRQGGKCHLQAICVVMHKLLRIVYGVLKHQKPFAIEVDEQNQRRSMDKQQQIEEQQRQQKKEREEEKHRYQAISTEAPISKRAAQKRKKQAASQASE